MCVCVHVSQTDTGVVYYLDIEVVETNCSVVSKKDWKNCEARPTSDTPVRTCFPTLSHEHMCKLMIIHCFSDTSNSNLIIQSKQNFFAYVNRLEKLASFLRFNFITFIFNPKISICLQVAQILVVLVLYLFLQVYGLCQAAIYIDKVNRVVRLYKYDCAIRPGMTECL